MKKIKERTFNFNESYATLQKIVAWFEQGNIDLEEGIQKYEEGNKIAMELREYLATVENRITDLKL
jgi:exodeoxyribonuclease VII small subunit